MTGNPAPQRLRTRAVLAAGSATLAAAGITLGLVAGVAGTADASGSTASNDRTPSTPTPTSTSSPSKGSGAAATTPSTSSSSSSSSNVGPADQNGPADGGSHGS